MPLTEGRDHPRYPPNDPREWLNRARSNLAQAAMGATNPNVYLEDLCFSAQQATEKALKAVLILQEIPFPRVHDLGQLIGLVEQTCKSMPEFVREAARLTRYAVAARYPSFQEPVTLNQYRRALRLSTSVVEWAEELVNERLSS
jgi:HEPN domain-containing protein